MVTERREAKNDVLAQARAKAAEAKQASAASTTNARETSETKEAYINTVEFSGRLGRGPEYTSTDSGKELVKASLAVFNPGNKETDTMWFDLVMWLNEEGSDKGSANREVFESFLMMEKGAAVVVKGRLTMRKYQDKVYYTITLSGIA